MQKLQMGCLQDGKLGRRDATHCPVVISTSDQSLSPGDHVAFTDKQTVVWCGDDQFQGIVDPFLERHTDPGDEFLVLIDPKLVGDLTHNFELLDRSGVLQPDDCSIYEDDGEPIDWCSKEGC